MLQDWHPEDIKAAVRRRGRTLSSVARDAGIKEDALRRALVVPRRAAEAAIAAELDEHPKVIWPTRYNEDGSRKRPQPVDNYRTEARFRKPSSVSQPETRA